MIFILYFALITFLAHIFYYMFFEKENHIKKIKYSLLSIFLFSTVCLMFSDYGIDNFESFIKNIFFVMTVLISLFCFNYLAHLLTSKIKAVYNYSTYIIIFWGISFFLTYLSFIFDAYLFDFILKS